MAIAARGDPLNEIHDLIEWELFRPRLSMLYASDRDQGGRPLTDVTVLMKLLVLQQWYGLSDYELERQAGERISFRHILEFPPQSRIVQQSGSSRIVSSTPE